MVCDLILPHPLENKLQFIQIRTISEMVSVLGQARSLSHKL